MYSGFGTERNCCAFGKLVEQETIENAVKWKNRSQEEGTGWLGKGVGRGSFEP